jgi:para-aminobenzoate synthetase component 1
VGLGAGRAVLSSSPELFLDLASGHVVTRPIKGTRPRRAGEAESSDFNRRERDNLLRSEKDKAELVMITDLERNDLGRVCDYGSVRVTEPRTVEAYEAVYHTVATVEGRLHAEADLVDLLRATFPGGSITGAPKVRAMQIIAELEPTRRSVYTGAVGYLAPPSDAEPAGRCSLNIAIRTLLVAGQAVHLQAGGGIVADSDPAAEFDETSDKARAMLAALGLAP